MENISLLWKLISLWKHFYRGEKNTFNIASEASYVYILRGLKMIKNAKNGQNMMLEVKQWYQAGQY